jgi:hypothetical protein
VVACVVASRQGGHGGRMRRGNSNESTPASSQNKTDLFAKPLDIRLCKLLALHQALNPAVEGWDGGRFDVGWGQVGGQAPNVLHVRIHSGDCWSLDRWTAELKRVGSSVQIMYAADLSAMSMPDEARERS